MPNHVRSRRPLKTRIAPGSGARPWVVVLLAAALSAALSACGGGGGLPATSATSAPAPPGGGGTGATTATPYYLSGYAGVQSGPNLPPLVGVDPAKASVVSIPGSTLLASNEATVGQWTDNGGVASAVGIRYRVWSGTDGNLYNTDLLKVSGAGAPTTLQLSSISMSAASTCPNPPTVINDYANPVNSLLVFRLPGSGGDCGSNGTDPFDIVPMSANQASAPVNTTNEPVDAARDATGAIKYVFSVMHGGSTPGVGVSTAANIASPTFIGALNSGNNGNGVTTASGNFSTLAVVPQADGSWVWVYRDATWIQAVNISSAGVPGTLYTVFTAADSDVIQGGAIAAGTVIFIAMTDTSNNPGNPTPPAYTCQLVSIQTNSLSTYGDTILHENSSGTGLSLVGLAGNNLVYFNNGAGGTGTVALESIPTTGTYTAPTGVTTLDSAPAFDSALGTVPAITVGNGVYYTKLNAVNGTPSVYYYSFATNAAAALGGGVGGHILGGEVASNIGTVVVPLPVYSAAVVATLANPGDYSGASVGEYASGTTAAAVYGTFASLTDDAYNQPVTLSEGLLQAGMPALISAGGTSNRTGSTAADLYLFTPGKAGLTRLTTALK